MNTPLSWSKRIDHLITYAVEGGASRERLLARLELSAETLENPDARVPLSKFFEAIECVAAALDDPLLALHYIDTRGFVSIDALGYLAKFSAAVGESMRRFVRYMAVLSDGENILIDVAGGAATFHLEVRRPNRPGKALLVEMYAAGFLHLRPRVSGSSIEGLSLKFCHECRAGTDPAAYRRFLGREPEFGAGENSWSFAADVLERPVLQADSAPAEFFEQYVSGKAGKISVAPFREQVERAISTALLDRNATLSEVARRMGMTPRTLQRRLSAAHLSFEDAVTAIRRTQAEEYLQRGVPISETSYLLGYVDPAALQRAFKRWVGSSPGE